MAKYLHRSFEETYKEFESALFRGKKRNDLPGVSYEEEEEEEEENINALNDETFGGEILDDWEDEHEKKVLRESTKEESSRSVHFQDEDELDKGREIEESLTALVLDDEPYDDPAISFISRSKPIGVPKPPGYRRHSPLPQVHANESGSPQLTSIWTTSPGDGSFLSSKSLPNNFGDSKPLSIPAVNHRRKSTPCPIPNRWEEDYPRSGSLSNASSLDNSVFFMGLQNVRTLEELERDLLGSSSPSKSTPPTPKDSSLPTKNSINLFPRFSSPIPLQSPKGHGPRVDQFGSPPLFMRPPLSFMHVPPPTLPKQQMAKSFSPQKEFHLRGHPPNGFIRHPHRDAGKRAETGRRHSSSEDEYAGLMTQQEKNWLISIQLNQLHFDNPYIDDYYYTAYLVKKMAIEKNECRKEDDVPPPVIPDRIKETTKQYTPPKVENSLGRVQVVSVLAPRRIIDLSKLSAPIDLRKTPRYRQLLYEIEAVYTTLINIEYCSKRLANATAGPDLEQIENESKKLLLHLQTQLSSNDKIVQFLQVRKGKRLLVRLNYVLDDKDRRRVVQGLLCSFPVINKKDMDGTLPNLYHLYHKAISTSNLDQLCAMICNINKTALTTLLSHKFGMTMLMLMLKFGEQAREDSKDGEVNEKWDGFLQFLATLISSSSCQIAKPLEDDKSDTVQRLCKRFPEYASQYSRLD